MEELWQVRFAQVPPSTFPEAQRDRATAGLHWWTDKPDILAGRDLVGGGTWLGVSRQGRIAFLTNHREPYFQRAGKAPSRGAIVTAFLEGSEAPVEYLQSLDLEAINGFNLLVLDLASWKGAYMTNRGPRAGKVEVLQQGLHGLSNGVLDEPWPKVLKAQAAVEQLLPSFASWAAEEHSEQHAEALGDLLEGGLSFRAKEEDRGLLPKTGMPEELEYLMSSVLIEPCELQGGPYGTRSQTALVALKSGSITLLEKSSEDGKTWKRVSEQFNIADRC